jgi:hypothetical protein
MEYRRSHKEDIQSEFSREIREMEARHERETAKANSDLRAVEKTLPKDVFEAMRGKVPGSARAAEGDRHAEEGPGPVPERPLESGEPGVLSPRNG